MPRELHRSALVLRGLVERLADLLGQEPTSVQHEVDGGALLASFPGQTYRVEWRSSSRVAAVAAALRASQEVPGDIHPLIAVPYMGEAGRALCAEAGTDWLDLSGNAHIVGPGLRIVVEGRPNLYKRPGRPRSAFAPKSARIARWLLMHPDEAVTQAELAEATGMDRGFTSRLVHRLLDDELVARDGDGRVFAPRPDLLLDAWAQDYDFGKHDVHRGVIAARSGTELVDRLAGELAEAGVEHAFTGLAAAWQLSRFATFRLATVYLPGGVAPELAKALGFRESERGANAWLVVPDDVGVLHGSADVEGLRCVHPVQVWLDLGAQPERAQEAAERLRSQHMRWSDA